MAKRSSSLLINESPLQALPSLACLVGLTGSVILQQIHYWLLISEHKIEGETWIYNSYDSWAKQFKWLKPRAIQKQILQLEKDGYLISGQFKYKSKNNTKWYRIDYDKLNQAFDGENSNSLLPELHSDGEDGNSDGENSHRDPTLNSQSLRLDLSQTTQKTITETTTETKKAEPSPVDLVFKGIHSYYDYPDKVQIDPIPNYGKEGNFIKKMIGRGFSPGDIMLCWSEKVKKRGCYVSMNWVNEDIKVSPGNEIDPDKYVTGKYGHMVRR